MRKSMVRTALAVGVVTLAAGCGGGFKSVFQPGAAPTSANKPAMSRAEATLMRFGLLQEETDCPSCWVTGGGAGNDVACDDGNGGTAKFGLVADPGGNDGYGGHLEFHFMNTTGGFAYDLGGKVGAVRCLEVRQSDDGKDTWGTVEFFGELKKEEGLNTLENYVFHVIVKDFGEPNPTPGVEPLADHLWIDVVDGQGNHPNGFPFECDTDDGNIQIHPTQASQL